MLDVARQGGWGLENWSIFMDFIWVLFLMGVSKF